VVSANASGPRRLRYGTVRDLLIGTTVVLADGTVASSGGKVVKNVAGYDLGKLYTGAHGTPRRRRLDDLAAAPGAARPRALVLDLADAAEAGPLVARLVGSTLTPTAVELLGSAGGRAGSWSSSSPSPSRCAPRPRRPGPCSAAGSSTTSAGRFGARPGGADDVLLRLAHVRSGLPQVLAALPAGAQVAASAATGVTYAAVPAATAADALPRLRSDLAAHDGSAVLLRAPDGVRDALDHWGPVGDALGLMTRVKDRFDPERRLSPGRFVGGL
jgi:glycolate oxidase FAD binding subunit